LHARELAVDGAGQRTRERRLADAGVILDQRMPLGQQRDEQVAQRLLLDLDGLVDVRPQRPPDCGERLKLLRRDSGWFGWLDRRSP
jgi:hypothetical protein